MDMDFSLWTYYFAWFKHISYIIILHFVFRYIKMQIKVLIVLANNLQKNVAGFA